LGYDAMFQVISPPYTMGLIKGGSRRRSLSRLASLLTSTLACWIRPLLPHLGLDLYICVLTPPSSCAAGSTDRPPTTLLACWLHSPPFSPAGSTHCHSRLLAPPTALLACWLCLLHFLPVRPAYSLDQCGAHAEPRE